MQTLDQAITAHKNGRLKEARAAYENVVAERGGDAQTFRCLAHLLKELNEPEEAEAAFRQAYDREEHFDGGTDVQEAGDDFHHGLFLKDTCIAAELASHLQAMGIHGESLKFAEEAVRRNPGDSTAYETLISLYGQEKNVEAASELYQQAPDLVQQSFFVCRTMSALLAYSGRFEDAVQARNKGLRIPATALDRVKSHSRKLLSANYMLAARDGTLHAGVTKPELSTEGGVSPVYVRLEDAIVLSGEWYVIDKNKTVFMDLNHGTPTGDPTPYYQDPGNLLRGTQKRVVLPEPPHPKMDRAVLVGGDPNYYHWMFDFLPKLMAVGKTTDLDDYPILVHQDILEYQLEQLEMAGIDVSRLLRLDYPGCYPVGELIVPLFPPATEGQARIRCRHEALTWLRALGHPVEGGGRKIYISRRDSGRRRIFNESTLIEALEREGFEIFDLESFSQKEKIDIFSTAGIVVACHGAGLANLAFAPSGCRIVEIIDPGWSTEDFKFLAAMLDQPYSRVMCRTYLGERKLPILGDAYITDQAIGEVLELVRADM